MNLDCLCVFFFFKQKTAYEMRISDWSSDVCSSDLPAPATRASADLCLSGARPVAGSEHRCRQNRQLPETHLAGQAGDSEKGPHPDNPYPALDRKSVV